MNEPNGGGIWSLIQTNFGCISWEMECLASMASKQEI